MAGIVYPRPLRRGDVIGVPAPSSGIPDHLRGRLDSAVAALESRGLRVALGELVWGGGLVSGPPADRAAELTAFFERADVRAVVPPWGGDLAIDLVGMLDWDALAGDPTWFVGWSDISTLLLPLTITTGVATLHGANLMDEPYELPEEFERWTTLASASAGDTVVQRSAPRRRTRPWADWEHEPLDRDRAYEEPTYWRTLSGATEAAFSGRLIGGCLDTVSLLAGTRFGDVDGFAARHAPEGLVVYLEVAEADAVTAARMLHAVRLAGWFDHANGVLIGRTVAPSRDGMSQEDAVRSALGDLDVPVILDFDTGHEPPQLPLVNGALAEIELAAGSGTITQRLVP